VVTRQLGRRRRVEACGAGVLLRQLLLSVTRQLRRPRLRDGGGDAPAAWRDDLRMVTRPRCSECRKTFTPSPCAGSKQKVCGPACRGRRDRKLTRARRRGEIEAYRADERERQASRRSGVRAARGGGAGGACHAPRWAPKSSEVQDEFVEILVRLRGVSRATLVRARSLKRAPARRMVVTAGEVSRATLDVQVCDSTGRSGPILGTCHA
jgi:hypothetical protein